MEKSVKNIFNTEKKSMGGVGIDQALPIRDLDAVNPFLLIHHINVNVPPSTNYRTAGVGPHPHRGFSPVTFIYKGAIHHRDSMGNSSVVSDGGTQWIHSGDGIIHSERPSKEFAKRGGKQEIIQFWVNTPAEFKREIPYYFPLSNILTPKVELDKITISVITGNYMGVQGPIKTFSPQTILRVSILKKAGFVLNIPENYNCLVYLLDGGLTINNEAVLSQKLVVFENDGSLINIEAVKSTRFVLLSGIPIHEPTVAYGPYVMNSESEIEQAITDYKSGKMGSLNETFDERVWHF
ncbi:MAG: pirin-like C-terminal cupin domain-containing protein [Bacteroidota bacterium]